MGAAWAEGAVPMAAVTASTAALRAAVSLQPPQAWALACSQDSSPWALESLRLPRATPSPLWALMLSGAKRTALSNPRRAPFQSERPLRAVAKSSHASGLFGTTSNTWLKAEEAAL